MKKTIQSRKTPTGEAADNIFLGSLLRRQLLNNTLDDYHHLLHSDSTQDLHNLLDKSIIQKLHSLTIGNRSMILLFTFLHGVTYPNEISKVCDLTPSGASQNLLKLESLGFIECIEDIDDATLQVIKKKIRAREAGTKKLRFYRISNTDNFITPAITLSLNILGIDKAQTIAGYVRDFSKPDYRIAEALQHLLKFDDRSSRKFGEALEIWAGDLQVPQKRLLAELNGIDSQGGARY